MSNKVIYRRRRRQAPAAHDSKFFKRESGLEQSFFGEPQKQAFFQNQHTIQRKCEHCEEEEKNVHREADKKEDDKMVQKMEEKKEDDKSVHRMEDKKEDKEVHRMEDKKEDKEVHRMEDKKKEDKDVNRKAGAASTPAASSAASYISSLNGKGSELPAASRHFFQNAMGANFKDVKIHTGSQAAESAAAINAKAYTIDNNIVFAANQFNTETHEGKKLLAHELTHVMQQSGNVMRKTAIPNSMLPENELEKGLGTVTGHGSSKANKRNYGTSVNVQGSTDANFDHGNFSTERMHTTRATGYGDCGTAACVHATGTMVSVFRAHPTVTIPAVPSGLTPCQQQRVQTFITTVLAPHEQQHARAFNTYNGIVRTAFDYTGCQTADALANHLQPIHDGIENTRAAAANALSDALDPFNGTIDINCASPHTAPATHHPHH
jgi:hypothetical protein